MTTSPETRPYPGYYARPRESWDSRKCERTSRSRFRDGLGTIGGPRGLVQCDSTPYPAWGTIRFNGGCVEDGEWYRGWDTPFPKLAAGFVWAYVCTWGYVVARESELEERGLKALSFDENGFQSRRQACC